MTTETSSARGEWVLALVEAAEAATEQVLHDGMSSRAACDQLIAATANARAMLATAPPPDTARGEWPARYMANGPQGTFYTDDLKLADELLHAYGEDDDWTMTYMLNPTGTLTAPPPAAARGDVRGLDRLGWVRRAAIERLRNDLDVTGVMVHDEERTDSVPVYLAAEGAQAGDVEQRARELLAAEYAKDERYGMAHAARNGSNDVMPAIRAIASALSQQPEARDVVDVAAVRQAVADYMRSEGCSCCRGGDHEAHAKALALLLDVPAYADESGYDFDQFATGARNG